MQLDTIQTMDFIEKNFGYYEAESVNSIVTDYKRQIAELQLPSSTNSYDPTPEIIHLQKECDRIQGLYYDSQNSNKALQRQLQQVQKEHASLQSQAQTQCTYDWKEINGNLDDINTLLKVVGQSISDRLSDRYISATLGKKPEDVTTLDAHDMPQLISWLGYDAHTAGRASLISSSDGSTGLEAETFFDFAIRAQLCTRLLSNIFLPFHPLLEPTANDWLLDMYEKIKQQGIVRSINHKLEFKSHVSYRIPIYGWEMAFNYI
ncbi:AIG1 domain protein, putative, partial [Rhizoctonia solani AG-3 Rhs1AP]